MKKNIVTIFLSSLKIISKNKKARYNYTVLDQYTAGIQLQGSEIKPIKNNNTSISEAYCYFKDGELFIKGMHVKENINSNKYDNHDPLRERKLLLTKRELKKLKGGIQEKGLTIVPLTLILDNKGLIKLEIGLCKGKKLHDKKMAIKERDLDREMKNF